VCAAPLPKLSDPSGSAAVAESALQFGRRKKKKK
jgi:hypothetical protein